jgi:hypothetical protein
MREQCIALEHRVHVSFVRRRVSHIPAIEQYPARARLLETGDESEGGRLATARGAEQGVELAARYLSVDPVDGDDVVEALGEIDEFDGSRGHELALTL